MTWREIHSSCNDVRPTPITQMCHSWQLLVSQTRTDASETEASIVRQVLNGSKCGLNTTGPGAVMRPDCCQDDNKSPDLRNRGMSSPAGYLPVSQRRYNALELDKE
jgi:hypothetical protein